MHHVHAICGKMLRENTKRSGDKCCRILFLPRDVSGTHNFGVWRRPFKIQQERPVTSTSSMTSVHTLKLDLSPEQTRLAQQQGPLHLYENLITAGELHEDPEQLRVMEILNAVYHGAPQGTSKGLYLYGSVGCGKSMAMDLFHCSMLGRGVNVDRKHFHDFLNEVHVALHHYKRNQAMQPKGLTPVERFANELAGKIDVLCFDEFAITTIQDCVLLMPLFSTLFRCGVTMVATSNRAPEDLYTDGLNRHLYLPPFLSELHAHCKIHSLQSSTDYRSVKYANSSDAGVFCWPCDRSFVDGWFSKGVWESSSGRAGSISVSYGRSLAVPELSACRRIARFSFNDLCRQHLSADDYLWLCRQVHTILLDDVPVLSVDDHNEARRFTLLIDCCYEQHVRLVCSMSASPHDLLGGLSKLRDMNLATLGGHAPAGCGDGDTSPSSSGVLQAIRRIKESIASRENGSTMPVSGEQSRSNLEHMNVNEVLSAEIDRVRGHGDSDVDVWRQGGEQSTFLSAPPQVSKAWDDRRRISQFTWEAADPTAEQQTIKGVFSAAVASLQESGFAVDRAISRMQEMQTVSFQELHKVKHCLQ